MAEKLVATAGYPDGTEAALYSEQDGSNRITGVRVTVPEGHIAVVRAEVFHPSNVAGVYTAWFPGNLAEAGLPAGSGGSDETITLAKQMTPAYRYSVALTGWR